IPGQTLFAQVVPYANVGTPLSTAFMTTDADGKLQLPLTLAPYAGVQYVDIYDSDDLHAPFRGETKMYRTAAPGAVLPVAFPCSFAAGSNVSTSVLATVFGPNGHPVEGVAMNFSVQPGNGFLLGVVDPTHLSTYNGISDFLGFASVSWVLPSAAGTYHLAVKGLSRYDRGPGLGYTLRR